MLVAASILKTGAASQRKIASTRFYLMKAIFPIYK
jgi:hypothetical protein